jgi:small membrane protein
MKLIQFILLTGFFLSILSYFRWFRNAILDKFVIVLIFIAACYFVFNPDSTTKLAVKLGVGRGTDLLLYLSIITFSYLLLLLYAKIKNQEKQIAALTRKQALLEAIYDKPAKYENPESY